MWLFFFFLKIRCNFFFFYSRKTDQNIDESSCIYDLKDISVQSNARESSSHNATFGNVTLYRRTNNNFWIYFEICLQFVYGEKTPRTRFTKQGKLARERNSKTAPMGVEISAGDLLTMSKLKNTDATPHLHIYQCNIPSAAQIECRADFFGGTLNNGANTSNLTSANVSKLHCVIHFNTLLP